MARVYVPLASWTDRPLALPADEAHYVQHVLRLGPGAVLQVFDGHGREWAARVVSVGRGEVSVALGAPVPSAPEPPVAVTLAIAVLKNEYMDVAVRDATMMGAAAIQPLITSHGAVGVRQGRVARLAARWQRIALASTRQCGRSVVPPVHEPLGLTAWLAAEALDDRLKLVLLEPARARQGPPVDLAAWRPRAVTGGSVVLVGPEGGWATEEIAEARSAGFIPWTVSRRTLRADAAGVAALSVLFYAWEHSGIQTQYEREPREST